MSELAFPAWIAEHCTTATHVLDIGAGRDRKGIDAAVARRVGRLVGIDPSDDIFANAALSERHRASIEEFARTDPGQFDVLFCTMVLEHVTNPLAFLQAGRSLLKPGGMFFAITPNVWHYFGLATKVTSRFGVNEWLLDRLIGKRARESYHFPTFYKINSIRSISRMLALAEFQDAEFRCFDNPREYYYVVPRPLHFFPEYYSRTVYCLRAPHYMGRLMFRATVPGEGASLTP